MRKLYRMLRQHGFTMPETQLEIGFIRGWISCFITFQIPEKEQELFWDAMFRLKDSDFLKIQQDYLKDHQDQA